MSSDCTKTNLDLSGDVQNEEKMVSEKIHHDLPDLMENKKCKQRLFLGEGDFSYTEALIHKHLNTHKQLAHAIVATELTELPELEQDVDADIMNQRTARINSLREKGVRVLFGIDGRELHRDPQIKGERFKRIHWNCPFRWANTSDREFIQIIADVFASCEKIQLKGDRIHITLIHRLEDADWYEHRQYIHNLVKGSVQSGYKLIRKRRFGKDRYPGYKHRKGDDLAELNLPAVHREFVFEKDSFSVSKTEKEILSSLPVKISNEEKIYWIDINKKNVTNSSKIELEDCYFVCSTDDDSSDYYDSSD